MSAVFFLCDSANISEGGPWITAHCPFLMLVFIFVTNSYAFYGECVCLMVLYIERERERNIDL